ncbi:hypothetical protein L596_002581 [Steinernema carpocapsae]|uniref:Uncharacterized protein n=1 Tax=Steinernema carpocapsae TaxID=34508 RepID=A0A4U8USI9_STECR|nr:hypothetical protein L596_002581 [Steinernema carpocapsae]
MNTYFVCFLLLASFICYSSARGIITDNDYPHMRTYAEAMVRIRWLWKYDGDGWNGGVSPVRNGIRNRLWNAVGDVGMTTETASFRLPAT